MHYRALAGLGLAFLAACASAQPIAPVWPQAEWERASPEAMGMDSRALALLVDYGKNVRMDSLVVTRHGRLVLEAYYAPYRKDMLHRVNSATKAVVGTLAGIAIAEGKLPGTQARMLDLFPDRRVQAVDDRKRSVTLQTLLDNTSGLQWDEPLDDAPPRSAIEMGRSRDWSQYVLDRPMATEPGAVFNYNSGASHLVSTIVARAAGMPTQQYAREKLFQPLGIDKWRWREDPQGIATGGWGLYLRTADMARYGHLYAQGGQWNGRQVVPREWVQKVFDAKAEMFPGRAWRYADYWWTLPNRKAYLAVGFLRQLVVVMPETGVVAAFTGHADYPIENVVEHLERAARSSGPLPPDAEGVALLAAKARAVGEEQASSAAPLPPIAQQVSGRTYAFSRVPWGWRSILLRLDAPAPTIEIQRADGKEVKLALGLDGRFAYGESPEGITALRSKWQDGQTLRVDVRVPEEAISLIYDLRFGGTGVEVTETGPFAKRTASGEQR